MKKSLLSLLSLFVTFVVNLSAIRNLFVLPQAVPYLADLADGPLFVQC
jgi:hypothetical protein